LQGINQYQISITNLIIQKASKNNISGIINASNNSSVLIHLTDITGKCILSKSVPITSNSSNFSLDLDLNSGIYLINLSNQSEFKTYKLVIAP
jgi:hypothetical protein